MSRHVSRHTFRCPPPPPLRVMVARPAQVTQVTQVQNPLLHEPLHGIPCHRPPPPPPCHGGTRDIGDTREVHKHNKAQARLHETHLPNYRKTTTTTGKQAATPQPKSIEDGNHHNHDHHVI